MQRFSLSRRSARREIHGWIRPLKLVVVAMAATLALYAQTVSAIGVGEPRYLSSLFQPLRIDIPLDADGSDPDRVHVEVSIVGDGAGEGAPTTATLRREWLVDEHGHPFLRVTSPQVVNEPMLTLRVDVGDASLQVRRDLTLLFDPPSAPVAVAARVPEALPSPTAEIQTAAATVSADPLAALPPDSTPRPAAPTASPATDAATVARSDTPASNPASNPASKPAGRTETARAAPSTARKAAKSTASAPDRQWQQLGPVEPGDTLEMLSKRVRNGADIPLPLVSALLRWLNPEAFQSTTGEPIPGAALKFPKPELLAAQLTATGSVALQLDSVAAAAPAALPSPEPVVLTGEGLRMATALSPQSLQLALEIDARRLAEPALAQAPAELPAAAIAASSVVAAPPAAPPLSPTTGNLGTWSSGLTLTAVMASGLLVFLMLKVVAGTPLAIGTTYSPSQALSHAAAQESERLFGDHERLPQAVVAEGFDVPLVIPKKAASAEFVAAAAPTPAREVEPDETLLAASAFKPVVTPPVVAEAPATWDLAQFDLQEHDDLNPPDNRRTH